LSGNYVEPGTIAEAPQQEIEFTLNKDGTVNMDFDSGAAKSTPAQ
jgi:hypothetical protein